MSCSANEDDRLKAFKEFQLGILDEFLRVCAENGLCYYAAWGTLLGAARHQGFIPWDDDIDVWMPARDYYRFRELCLSGCLRPGFYFQSHASNPENCLSWQRIGVSNSTSVQRKYAAIRADSGVCMDIFPLMPAPADKRARGAFLKKARSLSRLADRSVFRIEAKSATGFRKAYYWLMGHYPRILNEKIWGWAEARTVVNESLDLSDSVCDLWWFGEKRWFVGDRALSFEGRQLCVPMCYEEVLDSLYGTDWWMIPPEEKRVQHSGGGNDRVIVSLDTSYKELWK